MSKEKDFFDELEDNKKLKKEVNDEYDSNIIADALKILGWITLVLGFIVGCVTGRNQYDEFDFGRAFSIWIVYAIAFLGIYAMAEVIQILHDIRAELRKKK